MFCYELILAGGASLEWAEVENVSVYPPVIDMKRTILGVGR